jgi:hypothetical protein
MKRRVGVLLFCIGLALWVTPACAALINFEGYADSTPLTNQYSAFGLNFANATVITAGFTLNESEFPPRSGSNVAFDDGGPITVSFSTPMKEVEGYFTYTVPLTLTFFNSSDATIGTANSAFASNLALSGDPGSAPNELIGLIWNAGIAKVIISGDPLGSSFTVDDLTVNPVPIPATFFQLTSGLLAMLGLKLRRRHKI